MNTRWMEYQQRETYPEVLRKLIQENGLKNGVEVGVLRGRNLFYQVDMNPEVCMTGVDRWEENPGEDNREAGYETYRKFNLQECYEHVSKEAAKRPTRVHILRMDSVEATSCFIDGSLDFFFLDGDHSYRGFQRDLVHWMPKIRTGGFYIGHDCKWPGVRRALNEAFGNSWTEHAYEVWSIQKR